MDWLYILLSRCGINIAPTILSNALRMFAVAEKKLQQASNLEEQRIDALTRKVQKLNNQISAAKATQTESKNRIEWIGKKISKLREFTQ